MTNLTEDHLTKLAERHPTGEIHGTITQLKSLVGELSMATDAARKATLISEIQILGALLDSELREGSRAGEDYINDGEFLSNK